MKQSGITKLKAGNGKTSMAKNTVTLINSKGQEKVIDLTGVKIIKSANGQDIYVDEEDFEKLNNYKWYVDKKKGYVRGNKKNASRKACGVAIKMHRLIMKCPKGKQIDHKNCIKRDNRKCNLEIVDNRTNCLRYVVDMPADNETGILGIYKEGNSYRARWMTEDRIKKSKNSLSLEAVKKARYDGTAWMRKLMVKDV
jgi:hypothetical protein